MWQCYVIMSVWFTLKPQTTLTHYERYTRLLGSCGDSYRNIGSGSFRSFRLGPPWIRLVLAHLTNAYQVGILGIRGLVNALALCHVHWVISEQLLWCVRAHCPTEGHCHWGVLLSTSKFGWAVSVKWHSHECRDPRFPSRTLDCYEMINVYHLPCLWF